MTPFSRILITGVFLLWLAMPTRNARAVEGLQIGIKGGNSLFLFGKSNALPHRFKPTLRVDCQFELNEDLRIGVELSTVATFNENYRLNGGYLNLVAPMYEGDLFALDMVTGWGLGTGPPILFADLESKETLTLWVQAGLQLRWRVIDEFFELGLDLVNENLSILSLTGTLVFHI